MVSEVGISLRCKMTTFHPISNPSEWPDWKQMFEHRIATKLHKDDEDVKVNSDICNGERSRAYIFKSVVFDDQETSKYWISNGGIR